MKEKAPILTQLEELADTIKKLDQFRREQARLSRELAQAKEHQALYLMALERDLTVEFGAGKGLGSNETERKRNLALLVEERRDTSLDEEIARLEEQLDQATCDVKLRSDVKQFLVISLEVSRLLMQGETT